MRWKAYNRGDVRVMKRFALFPVECNREWAWMEHYYTVEIMTDYGWYRKWTLTPEEYETYKRMQKHGNV